MKFFAVFLCMFLFLLFGGTLCYVYIMWNTYWQRVAKLNHKHYVDQTVVRITFDETTGKFAANDKELKHFHLDGVSAKIKQPQVIKTVVNNGDIPSDKLLKHIKHYETQIVSQLRNAIIENGKSVQLGEIKNSYHVNYKGALGKSMKPDSKPEELICDLGRRISFKTFNRGDAFFRSQTLDQYFPETSFLESRSFNNCAVVSSAGSLASSKLGHLIDSHDFVIRFNNAPTEGHEKDVGSKTSLRIVNSQVVAKPEFKFLEARTNVYNQQPVLVWDPSAYNATVRDWYQDPDYPFFETFFHKRLMKPEEEMHLLNPSTIWSVWDWIQSHTKWPLVPNPPSSGFLGIVIALTHCHTVHIYEYVPSMRLTQKCHYYDEEINIGCTIGIWHPLAAEKLLALAMNGANETEVYKEGYLTMKGLKDINCN